MKTKFKDFINESIDKKLPEKNLEDIVPEKLIFDEFKKFGYDAFDVNYMDNIKIVVSPKSYAKNGHFSNRFNQQMSEICDNIGADDFNYSSTFQVIFYFDEDKHPELIPN